MAEDSLHRLVLDQMGRMELQLQRQGERSEKRAEEARVALEEIRTDVRDLRRQTAEHGVKSAEHEEACIRRHGEVKECLNCHLADHGLNRQKPADPDVANTWVWVRRHPVRSAFAFLLILGLTIAETRGPILANLRAWVRPVFTGTP